MQKILFAITFLILTMALPALAQMSVYTNQEALDFLLSSPEFKANIPGELDTVVIHPTVGYAAVSKSFFRRVITPG